MNSIKKLAEDYAEANTQDRGQYWQGLGTGFIAGFTFATEQKNYFMKTKEEIKKFVDACVSSGRYVEAGLKLPLNLVLEIESAMVNCNDATARTKIRKILVSYFLLIFTKESSLPQDI